MINDTTFIEESLRAAGSLLMKDFGKPVHTSRKESQSNIVTKTDLASEDLLTRKIETAYPDDSILSEEKGFIKKSTKRIWIIDPLDGTSNFAVGLPWFGVLLTMLEDWQPKAAGIYFPVSDTIYCSQTGINSTVNGRPLKVTDEKNLRNVLVTYQIDNNPDKTALSKELEVMKVFINNSRNLRITNSCLDYCLLAEGKIGAVATQSTKIWDIAPAYLLIKEAGGEFTDIYGKEISFRFSETDYMRTLSVLTAPHPLHTYLTERISRINNEN